jgi:hypothetical protein
LEFPFFHPSNFPHPNDHLSSPVQWIRVHQFLKDSLTVRCASSDLIVFPTSHGPSYRSTPLGLSNLSPVEAVFGNLIILP